MRQAIRRGDKDVALALAQGTVKRGRDRVPLDRISAELGIRRWPRGGRDFVDQLEREERLLRDPLAAGPDAGGRDAGRGTAG